MVLTFVLFGCHREEIKVYTVKQENDAIQPVNLCDGGIPGLVPHPDLKARLRMLCQLPPGWVEQAPTSMRVASFTVIGPHGQKADVGVIPLPEITGRELDMVNMWRSQLGLEQVKDDEIVQLTTRITIGSLDGKLFDIVGDLPPEGTKSPLRILVAMANYKGHTWFFKMLGDAELVAKEKDAFVKFVQSVKLPDDY